ARLAMRQRTQAAGRYRAGSSGGVRFGGSSAVPVSCSRACEGIELIRGWLPLALSGRRLVGRSVDAVTSLALSVELWSRGSASQPVCCQQVIGERMPERHCRGLDQATHRNEAEAVVFEVGVDPLDELAPCVHVGARLRRHPTAPLFDTVRLAGPRSGPPDKRLGFDVLTV